MRFPLTVSSLLLLALLLVWQLASFSAQNRKRRPAFAASGDASPADRLAQVCMDAMRYYLPFAAVALLMLSFGKPGLLPQYTGWALVVLQVVRGAAVYAESRGTRFLLVLMTLVCLAYLWILQLPLFDPFPL